MRSLVQSSLFTIFLLIVHSVAGEAYVATAKERVGDEGFFVQVAENTQFQYQPIVKAVEPYDYKQFYQDLQILEKRFGATLTIEKIGESSFGKPIWAIRLGKGKEHILLNGAHHGREWITSNLLMMMLERYTNAYVRNEPVSGIDTSILDKISIWFVPMLNPDGIDIQQGKFPPHLTKSLIKMNEGKKDFSRWKANGLGIDLNRQYPAGWDELTSPKKPSYKFYKGKKPFVAKEVKAFASFVEKINPLAAISYHSSGREIYWHFGKEQNIVRDYFLGEKLSFLTGYSLATPPEEAVGGGFTDWFIQTYNRPAFTFELCDFDEESHPPISQLQEEWERNELVGLYLVNEIEKIKDELKEVSK